MLQKNFTSFFMTVLIVSTSLTSGFAQTAETSATEVQTTMPLIAELTTTTLQQDDLTSQAVVHSDNQTTAGEIQTAPPSDDPATSVTLPSGVVYQIIKAGSGPETTTTGTRLIHYTLFLTKGQKAESSLDAEFPVPFSFVPGEGQAIKGMEDGTNGMRVGEIRDLYVPADQGYGEKSHGKVPPNSPLHFTLELVDIK